MGDGTACRDGFCITGTVHISGITFIKTGVFLNLRVVFEGSWNATLIWDRTSSRDTGNSSHFIKI